MLSKAQSDGLTKIIFLCDQSRAAGASPFSAYGRIKALAEGIRTE